MKKLYVILLLIIFSHQSLWAMEPSPDTQSIFYNEALARLMQNDIEDEEKTAAIIYGLVGQDFSLEEVDKALRRELAKTNLRGQALYNHLMKKIGDGDIKKPVKASVKAPAPAPQVAVVATPVSTEETRAALQKHLQETGIGKRLLPEQAKGIADKFVDKKFGIEEAKTRINGLLKVLTSIEEDEKEEQTADAINKFFWDRLNKDAYTPNNPVTAAPVAIKAEIPEVKKEGKCPKCNKLLDEKKDVVVTLPCSSQHQFHFNCIQNDMKNEEPECPECNEPVDPTKAFIHFGDYAFQPSSEICPICPDPLNPFVQQLSVLKCGKDNHIFHTPCIEKYGASGHGRPCPICRAEINVKKTIGERNLIAEQKALEEEERERREQEEKKQDVNNLFNACRRNGNVETVREIIKRRPELINVRYVPEYFDADLVDVTPLTLAANTGNEEVVRFLLNPTEADGKRPINLGNNTLEINALSGQQGWNHTALFRAVRNGHLEILNLLLGKMSLNERRFALSQRSIRGGQYSNFTPLHRAISIGRIEMVKRLVPLYQADEELRPILTTLENGRSLIDLAWDNRQGHDGMNEVIRFLFNAGITQMRNETRAAILGSDEGELANFLIEKTVDANERIKLLFAAVRGGNDVRVKRFIDLGVGVDKLPEGEIKNVLDLAFEAYEKLSATIRSGPVWNPINIPNPAFVKYRTIMRTLLQVPGTRRMSPETRVGILRISFDAGDQKTLDSLNTGFDDATRGTIFHAAIKQGADEKFIDYLLSKNFDKNAVVGGKRPIDVAAERLSGADEGGKQVFRSVIKVFLTRYGVTVMSDATRRVILKDALETGDATADAIIASLIASTQDKTSLLFEAIKNGSDTFVKKLIEANISVDKLPEGEAKNALDLAFEAYGKTPATIRSGSLWHQHYIPNPLSTKYRTIMQYLLQAPGTRRMSPETRVGILGIVRSMENTALLTALCNNEGTNPIDVAYERYLVDRRSEWLGMIKNLIVAGESAMQPATKKGLLSLLELETDEDYIKPFISIMDPQTKVAQLHTAIKNKKETLVKTLLAKGVNIEAEFEEKRPIDVAYQVYSSTPIHWNSSIINIIKELLRRNPTTMKPETRKGILEISQISRDEKFLAPLIRGMSSEEKIAAYHKALEDADFNEIKKWIGKVDDVNVAYQGKTPMQRVNLNFLDVPVINFLLDKGVTLDPHIIFIAIRERDRDSDVDFAYIIDLPAFKKDPNIKDRYGFTALHYAAQYGLEKLAEKLIAVGADVNAVNNNGETPRDLAVAAGYASIVKIIDDARKDRKNPAALRDLDPLINALTTLKAKLSTLSQTVRGIR